MEQRPIVLKTVNAFGQDPERLYNLVKQDTVRDLKAIWSKEGLILNSPDVCIVGMVHSLLEYARRETCGKCTPCREGTRRMFDILERVKKGTARTQDLLNLRELANAAAYACDCSFGEIVGFAVLDSMSFNHPLYTMEPEVKRDPYIGSWLKNAEYIAHIRGKSRCAPGRYFNAHFTPCQLRCPLGTDIAYFLSAIAMNKNTEAKEHVSDVNYLPRALGKVCGLCKEECTLRQEKSGAIDINGLKHYVCCEAVIYKEFENVHLDRASYLFNLPLHRLEKKPRPEKAAIVGGGPAGLSAAAVLTRLGYKVTLLEQNERLGGLMRYAIPQERLSDELLDLDLEELTKAENLEVKCGTALGRNIQIEDLLKDYGAVLIAAGAQKPVSIGLEGEEECPQVLNFLHVMKAYNLNRYKPEGKKAGIIGAGNSAMDVATASKRVGYETTVYYRRTRDKMRADAHEIKIAEEAGVDFEFEMVPRELVIKEDKLQGVIFEYKGERIFREMDVLIPSIGQVPNLAPLFPDGFTLETEKGGYIRIDPESGQTSHPKIFAAGDILLGRTVANSIQEGTAAALNIHRFLSPRENTPLNPWVGGASNGCFASLRKIASGLYGIGDPYKEELRDRWNNSIKSKLRRTGKSEIEAAHKESGACQRCRFIISMAH